MVDGLQQAAMFHRAPPSLVDTLVVRGDIFINHIGVAKSNPPVERLPTPSSPSESLYASFVHIPEDVNTHSLSHISQTVERLADKEIDTSKCISQTSSQVSEEASSTAQFLTHGIKNSGSPIKSETQDSTTNNSFPDHEKERSVPKEEKNVTFEDSIGASGSGSH